MRPSIPSVAPPPRPSPTQEFTDLANSPSVGYNIDLCSTCGCEGLRLYLCDACPAAFHSSCAGCKAQELQRAGPAFCRPCRKVRGPCVIPCCHVPTWAAGNATRPQSPPPRELAGALRQAE